MAGTDRQAVVTDESGFAVVLVRPQMGENVGTAARAMLNFALTDLRLVAPSCGWPNAKAVNAASGASEVLNAIRVFDDVESAVADLNLVFASTARPRDMTRAIVTAEGAAVEMRNAAGRGERVGVLFGPERTGLENEDLALADALLSVPLNPGFASLNLAQAVLLIAYEWFKAGDATPARRELADDLEPATKADVDGLLAQLVGELDDTAFFRSGDRRTKRIQELEMLFQRRNLRTVEVHTLRGVVKALARRRRARG
ncbi:MAG: RNA methyltransferase [Pseudomonadota bacterium]